MALSVGKGPKLIGTVGSGGKKWVSMVKGAANIDSAAEESVCPEGWCVAAGIKEVKEVDKLKLIRRAFGPRAL